MLYNDRGRSEGQLEITKGKRPEPSPLMSRLWMRETGGLQDPVYWLRDQDELNFE